jgi:hypothetical protein
MPRTIRPRRWVRHVLSVAKWHPIDGCNTGSGYLTTGRSNRQGKASIRCCVSLILLCGDGYPFHEFRAIVR